MSKRDDWRKRKFCGEEKPTPLTPDDLPSMGTSAWRLIWKAAIKREENREHPRPQAETILRLEALDYLIKTEEP